MKNLIKRALVVDY